MALIHFNQIKKDGRFYFRGNEYKLADFLRNDGYFYKHVSDVWYKINLNTILFVKFTKYGLIARTS